MFITADGLLLIFDQTTMAQEQEYLQYTSFPIVKLKCCCLPGLFRKYTQFVTGFCLGDRRKSRPFWSLAHSQNLRMLITFFRSERWVFIAG